MTESTQLSVTTPDGLSIDTSRQYKVIARGQCPKCSYFKTWEFTIQNPITGKQIPGHVTKDGYKIGNGECPFYVRLKTNARKAERKYQPKLAPTTQNLVNIVNANYTMQSQQVVTGNEISITLGSIKIVLIVKDALQVAREILDQVMIRQK